MDFQEVLWGLFFSLLIIGSSFIRKSWEYLFFEKKLFKSKMLNLFWSGSGILIGFLFLGILLILLLEGPHIFIK
jgi:hypothetical protein